MTHRPCRDAECNICRGDTHVIGTNPEVELCEWWALCANVATKVRPHPIIGNVPICEDCDAKVDRLEAGV